jgi:sugar O-acyltransferase (sialic acid O-acetyltransferase NeuD family)
MRERGIDDGQPKRVLILGTHMLAEEIEDFAAEIAGVEVVGFVENWDPDRCALRIAGLPVYWIDAIDSLCRDHWAVCGIATPRRRGFVEAVAAYGMPFATLVHPQSRVSPKSQLGDGSVISPGVYIASHTCIGTHVFVNRGVLIGHHTEIGDYVTIEPGANIAGACHIGSGTYVGMGATVIDRLTIGTGAVIGAGAMVTKDVPDHVQVVGNPARIVRRDIVGA